MVSRSQRHKERIQGIRSDGTRSNVPLSAMIDQTSTNNIADTYTFAPFDYPQGILTYSAQSVVAGVPQALVAGIAFVPATRTLNWTKPTGTYVVRITAVNNSGQSAYDDINIVVT